MSRWMCSAHNAECFWKEGGTKKDGTTYKGFYACPGKDANGDYCRANKFKEEDPIIPPAESRPIPATRVEPQLMPQVAPLPEVAPATVWEEKDLRIAKEAIFKALVELTASNIKLIAEHVDLQSLDDVLIEETNRVVKKLLYNNN